MSQNRTGKNFPLHWMALNKRETVLSLSVWVSQLKLYRYRSRWYNFIHTDARTPFLLRIHLRTRSNDMRLVPWIYWKRHTTIVWVAAKRSRTYTINYILLIVHKGDRLCIVQLFWFIVKHAHTQTELVVCVCKSESERVRMRLQSITPNNTASIIYFSCHSDLHCKRYTLVERG